MRLPPCQQQDVMQVAKSFKAHEKNVRALVYDAEHNMLLTGSFDRTLSIYQAG